jgi:hypothetical protein
VTLQTGELGVQAIPLGLFHRVVTRWNLVATNTCDGGSHSLGGAPIGVIRPTPGH